MQYSSSRVIFTFDIFYLFLLNFIFIEILIFIVYNIPLYVNLVLQLQFEQFPPGSVMLSDTLFIEERCAPSDQVYITV